MNTEIIQPHATVLWRRLDWPGHEAARLIQLASGWNLTGTAVFPYEHQPCRLDYFIHCDKDWHTLSAQVAGWVGNEMVNVELEVRSAQRWYVNGKKAPAVEGCIDVDLNFSPSTNLLPIRRLGLAVGEAGAVKAAWLRFPSFSFEPLEQRYHRVDSTSYRYESGGGQFVRDLQVNDIGFVTEYPQFWTMEAG